MTINGLNKFLKDKGIRTKKLHLSQLKGKRLAIDTPGLFYDKMYGAVRTHAIVYKKLRNRQIFLDDIVERFVKLDQKFKNYGIEVIFVFDGKAPPEKEPTQKKRKEAAKKLKEIMEKNFTLENIMNYVAFETGEIPTIFKMMKEKGINVYMDPTREAECYCAKLVKEKKVDWVFSQDCDAIAHLCPFLIRDLGYNDDVDVLALETVLRKLNLKHDPKLFTMLCVCAGTDYNENIKGLACHKLLKIIADCTYDRKTFIKQMKKKDGFEKINFKRTMQLFNSTKDENFLLK